MSEYSFLVWLLNSGGFRGGGAVGAVASPLGLISSLFLAISWKSSHFYTIRTPLGLVFLIRIPPSKIPGSATVV